MCFVRYYSFSTCLLFMFFFFKQKTAYEMRISDWSSDVCSSDLLEEILDATPATRRTLLFSATIPKPIAQLAKRYQKDALRISTVGDTREIGRASCRERVCQYV